jgi:hypothetical protein
MSSQSNFNNDVYDQPNITNDTYNNRQPILDSSVISPDQSHHASDNIYHQPIPNVASNNNDTIPPDNNNHQYNEPTRNYRQPTSENIPPPQFYPPHHINQNPLQSNSFHINTPHSLIFNISTINSEAFQQIYNSSTNNSSRPQQ